MDSQTKFIKENISDNYYTYKTNDESSTEIIFFEEQNDMNKTILNYMINNKNSFIERILRKNENEIKEKPNCFNMGKIKSLIISEKKLYIKFEKYINLLAEILNINLYIQFIEEGDFFKQDYEVNKIHEYLLENNFEKNSLIIGLGGGKITDLSGYIASTYFRGISLILIPTNLLAMVDASIGGKTGINHYKYGKNVIGTINQPNM